MKNQVFNFNGNNVSVITDDNNNLMFVAKEVCDVLELSDVSMATKSLDEDEKLVQTLFVSGQNRKVTLLTESGLYSLVLRSNKPEAKAFKKWVTAEVLPSIRKYGAYLTDNTIENVLSNPDLLIGLATQLKQERATNQRLQQTIEKQTAKVEFVDKILDTGEKIDIGQACKILELPFGRNTLFKELREKGIFFKNRNEPKQTFVERGLFQVKEQFIERSNHESFMVLKVLVTQKGLAFIQSLFNAEQQSKQLATLN